MRVVRFTVLLSSLLALLLLQGCATNPVTGEQDFVLMSESDEISLGAKYHQQMLEEMSVYPDPELAAYVNQVGQRIARVSHRPQLDYRFTVIDSPTVNAFALPGGYIYITRGILAYLNSEAELAAVLGHEVGHVTARHSVRQQSASAATGIAGTIIGAATGVPASQDLFNVFGKAMLSGYGRKQELESDRLGAQYLARAGYDPQAMLEVIGVLKNQELFEQQRAREEGRKARAYHGVFATHPDNDKRLQEVIAEANHLRTGAEPRTGRAEFLRHLDGLAFGPGENDGMVKANRFYHKPLNFGLVFAKGWTIENRPDRLLATAPDEAAFMQVEVDTLPGQMKASDYLRQKGLRDLRKLEPLNVKGFRAYTVSAPVSTGFGKRTARIIVLFDNQRAYLFTGVSRSASNQQLFDGVFRDVARSYHHLSAKEKKLATGLRLSITKARSNINFSLLAKISPIPRYAESELRLLNDLYPGGEPRTGQPLKVVR
ncbi:MAG: M48 family metalloprotease [Thiogranum sp.]